MHSIAKVRITTHQAGMVLVIFARPVSIKTLLPTHWQYTLKDTPTLRFPKNSHFRCNTFKTLLSHLGGCLQNSLSCNPATDLHAYTPRAAYSYYLAVLNLIAKRWRLWILVDVLLAFAAIQRAQKVLH
jgi:hypothetical protein